MNANRLNLRVRFLQLKPLYRFGLIGIAVVVIYVFLDDYCWSYARNWTQEGDRIQSLLERGAARENSLAKEVERAAIVFGSVEIPDDVAKTSESLALAVNETMKKHHITLYGYEALSGGKFSSGTMSEVAGAGRRIERMRGDVQFEISPDDVAQIIADFEESPSIDALNSIKLRWIENQKKVDIRLSTEAWAIAARDVRKKGGS